MDHLREYYRALISAYWKKKEELEDENKLNKIVKNVKEKELKHIRRK